MPPQPATFDKFLRKPWGTVGRERFEGCGGEVKRHAKHQQFFKTPIDMWNKKLRSFAMISAMHVAKVYIPIYICKYDYILQSFNLDHCI